MKTANRKKSKLPATYSMSKKLEVLILYSLFYKLKLYCLTKMSLSLMLLKSH